MSLPSPTEAAALAYAENGWQVFPADSSGAKKSHKSARYSNGQPWGATTDAHQIRRDFRKWPTANIGIRTGAASGFFVLEADTLEGHDIDGIGALRALEAEHGPLPPTRKAISPSGSEHYYFKMPSEGTITNSASEVAPGIDVRGDGGMVLAPPSVRPGKGNYRWLHELPIAEAPKWLLDRIAAAAARTGYSDDDDRGPASEPQAEPDRVARALAVIPNSKNLGWEQWNRVGMAAWRATGGTGFHAFDEWSKKSPKYKAAETRDRWAHYFRSPPTEIGAGTLFHMANEADPSWDTTHASPSEPQWPMPLDDAALHGLAGRIVRAIEPHSEADPVALLATFLAAYGNCIGRRPFFAVEGDRHYTNIFVGLVGKTSKARKGTSLGRIRELLARLDLDWVTTRMMGGLSSGEGLIWQIRDEITKMDKGEETVIDPGVSDKRLFITATEFAASLRVMARDGNSLSQIIRDAWDHGDLASLTKNSPARATGGHISIIGHCTVEELRIYLDATEVANGFANRFLFVCVKRSNVLPFGGDASELRAALEPLEEELRRAMTHAREMDYARLTWDPEARAHWASVYGELSEGKPGMLGAITGRAEAQVTRLALIYALLDCQQVIRLPHLKAALAFWRYSEASAKFIFGDGLGDRVADAILTALRGAHPNGLTKTQIADVLGRHTASSQIDRALTLLARNRLAVSVQVKTPGRPATVWRSGHGTHSPGGP